MLTCAGILHGHLKWLQHGGITRMPSKVKACFVHDQPVPKTTLVMRTMPACVSILIQFYY